MNDNVIVIADVSSSYFSVARYSGGIKYNGTVHIYCRERDILVREDWGKFYRKLPWGTFIAAVKTGKKPELPKKATRATAKAQRKEQSDNQPSLFD